MGSERSHDTLKVVTSQMTSSFCHNLYLFFIFVINIFILHVMGVILNYSEILLNTFQYSLKQVYL